MQRILKRAARRCTSTSVPLKFPHVQVNPASGFHTDEASTCSNDCGNITWRTSLARSMQVDIVHALRRGDRQQASLILSNLKHTNQALMKEDFSYILEYCSDAPDPLFILETLELMEVKGIGMSKNIYLPVIQALSRGGYWKEALRWLTLMGEKESTHGTLPFFNIFLNACGRKENLDDVESCLEKMEFYLLGKSEITYCELLKFAVLHRNLSAVHEIWKDCTRYYSPSIITQRKFVRALTILGDIKSACHILQRMVVLAAQNSDHLSVSCKRRYQSSRFDIPVPALTGQEGLQNLSDSNLSLSQEKLATREYPPFTKTNFFRSRKIREYSMHVQPELFQEETKSLKNVHMEACVSSAVKNVLRWSFNDIVHASARQKKFGLAARLFVKMDKFGLLPSKYTYEGLVKAVIAAKGIALAIKVVEAMERRGIEPNSDTLLALSVGCSKTLQLDLAEELLDRISYIKVKHRYAFNALLVGCEIMNEPERAVRILAKMKRMNIKPDLRTYEILFCLFGHVNATYEEGNVLSHVDVSKRLRTIETDMLSNNIQHSFETMKSMIRAFGAEGMVEEMLGYLNVSENILWKMDPYQKSDLYTIVLHALLSINNADEAIRTFKIMRACSIPANAIIYNIMIECCKLLPCLKSSYALLSLMLRDGFCPTAVTFTSLVKVLLAKEDLAGALDLLDMFKHEGIILDREFVNRILSHACARGQIHVVEYILEYAYRARVRPDPSTLWYTFCAYTEQGLYNTAIEALQVLSMRMISTKKYMSVLEKVYEKVYGKDSIRKKVYGNIITRTGRSILDKRQEFLSKRRIMLEDIILSEEPDTELRIIRFFVAGEAYLAAGLLNLRWCAVMGATIQMSPEKSLWARRLASSYDANKRPYISWA